MATLSHRVAKTRRHPVRFLLLDVYPKNFHYRSQIASFFLDIKGLVSLDPRIMVVFPRDSRGAPQNPLVE